MVLLIGETHDSVTSHYLNLKHILRYSSRDTIIIYEGHRYISGLDIETVRPDMQVLISLGYKILHSSCPVSSISTLSLRDIYEANYILNLEYKNIVGIYGLYHIPGIVSALRNRGVSCSYVLTGYTSEVPLDPILRQRHLQLQPSSRTPPKPSISQYLSWYHRYKIKLNVDFYHRLRG